MTSPTPPHLDLDALADVLAGEAGAGDADHLASCAPCTRRLEELRAAEERVIAVLAGLPAPPVPADLAQRLAALGEQEPAREGASVTTLPAQRTRRWVPAAAAAAVLFSGAGLGYALLSDRRLDESADSLAGGAREEQLVLNASGVDYSDTAAVEGALPLVLQGRAGQVTLDSAERSAGGGTAMTQDSAPQASPEAEAGSDAATTAQAPTAAMVEDPLARLRTRDGLEDCLAALRPPEEPDLQPLALDYAAYQGAPALAVVLPDPEPEKLSVFVVGPGCSRADDSTLHFLRVDAP